MTYYIKYAKQGSRVSIVTKRPTKASKGFGFAEGGFKSVESVKRRLSMMNIPVDKRPPKFR